MPKYYSVYLKRTMLLLLLLLLLPACSPGFLLQAAYEQSKILVNREKIEQTLEDPATPLVTKKKLRLVQQSREFSLDMGLAPGESYTYYADINRKTLVWVLAASKPHSFELATWWFPFVGEVPYKGFFHPENAEDEAQDLAVFGYEVFIREANAFSTLGWFNDPILSTTLENSDPITLVNTVIHEILHTTIWIPHHVDFNESLANFVGTQGAVEFFQHKLNQAPQEDFAHWRKMLSQAQTFKKRSFDLAARINRLYLDLDSLYKSNWSKEKKLVLRERVFQRHMKGLREKYPDLEILKKINNAELIQYRLYMVNLADFAKLYALSDRHWPTFLKRIEAIKEQVAKDPQQHNPFTILRQMIHD